MVVLVAALVLLDASLTFENIWPTPAISGAVRSRSSSPSACWSWRSSAAGSGRCRALRSAWLSAIWTVLVLGHYAEVTAPALYGRDINLYWDLRYMPDVAAMVTRVAPWWLIVLSVRRAC